MKRSTSVLVKQSYNFLSMNCRIKVAFLILFFISPAVIWSQVAYSLFNKKGKEVSTEKMLKEIANADVIIFGELHNNPICHWMEIEILRALSYGDNKCVMGMEMFERDQQTVLNELMDGVFPLKRLDQYTRTWPNYATDYQPLLEIALERGVPIVATNIPRQYASFVFKHGIDSLKTLDIASHLIPQLDFSVDTTLSSYAEVLSMGNNMPGHGSKNFLYAQAIKDVSMAERLLEEKRSDVQLYHINGSFHSKNQEGICHYLLKKAPELKIVTIQSREVDNPAEFQQQNDDKASFYLQINPLMTKSYE
jgi:uncharacterized iron-regulated protein